MGSTFIFRENRGLYFDGVDDMVELHTVPVLDLQYRWVQYILYYSKYNQTYFDRNLDVVTIIL